MTVVLDRLAVKPFGAVFASLNQMVGPRQDILTVVLDGLG